MGYGKYVGNTGKSGLGRWFLEGVTLKGGIIVIHALLYMLALGMSGLTADIVDFLAKRYDHLTQACVAA